MAVGSAFSAATERTSDTEQVFMERFEQTLQRSVRLGRSPSQIVLHELEGLQGRADLVDAHINALPGNVRLDDLAVSLMSPAKARLLALLRYGAPRSRGFLSSGTGFTVRSLGDHIRQLEKAGLVNVHDSSSVSLRCQLPWTMVDISAYEGKLTNWRRALHQAISYRSYSRSAWIVMPELSAQHAKRLSSVFWHNGIGLISISEDGSTRIEIKCKKRRPTSRRIYLMAVGAIVRRFLEKQRRSHRRLRPEAIQCI